MTRVATIVMVALSALATTTGCKKKVTSSTDTRVLLKGFPYNVELFAPAELARASRTGKGFGGKYPSFEWRFNTKASYADVVAFYDQRFPSAQRRVDAEEADQPEPSIDWTIKPDGQADPDELVVIGVSHDTIKTVGYTLMWNAPEERFPRDQ